MTDAPDAVPTAAIKPRRRISAAWIVPVVALLAAVWLAVGAWRDRGIPVQVQLAEVGKVDDRQGKDRGGLRNQASNDS